MASLTVYSQPVNQVFEEWVTADGTQNYFIKAAVETDADGFVYVAGATLNNAGNYDLLVSKYDAEGNVLWTDQYDGTGNGNDAATALVVDANGNVFVTGTTFTSSTDTLDVVTIGYDNNGTRDWLDVYAGADELADYGTCITVTSDAVYVGGSVTSATDGLDFLALRYRLTGTLDWDTQKDYNSLSDVCTQLSVGDADIYLAGATNTTGFDWDMVTMSFDMTTGTFGSDATASGGSVGFAHVRAMDRDLDGNIYLTGTVANMSTGYDIHTVKIDTFMNVLWDVDYSSSGNHDDEGNALAIDPSNGNVYVGGFKDVSGQGTDFVTLMYNSAGSLQWSAMWNDTADGGDTVKALVVDASGNVSVTGSAWNGSSLDYHTVQYDDTGTLLWEHSFNDKYNFTDAPMDIALTSDNGVVVTGQSLNPDSTWSYVTVKYLAHEFILPVDSDSVSTSLRWLTNRDQLLDTDTNLVERVKYYSNQCYPNLYFMDDTLSYVFFQGVDTTNNDTLHRIDMTFNGANAAQKLLPMDKESYWNNYYLGHIPEGRPFVSLHDRLVKQDVWPNIDVVYSSNQRGLKYYIVVHPGGETGAISLEYHGYDALSVDGNEALVIESSIGELVQPQALAYEMDANGELDLLGWQPEYLVSGGEVTLDAIGSWTGDLVIEVNWGYASSSVAANLPEWGTYYGGTGGDYCLDMDSDENGNVFVTGGTNSTQFPTFGSPIFQQNLGGFDDAFIGRISSSYLVEWMTYYGGQLADWGNGVISDIVSNRVYGCGFSSTACGNPLTTQALSPTSYRDAGNGTASTGFVVALNRQIGTRQWATFFGANGGECTEIDADAYGNIYVVGQTPTVNLSNTCLSPSTTSSTSEFPLCNSSAFIQTAAGGGGMDAFVAKFNPATELIWSTIFGGNGDDRFLTVAVEPNSERLYVAGATSSTNNGTNIYTSGCPITSAYFPLCKNSTGYFQSNLNGTNSNGSNSDGLIGRFTLDGILEWSSFFGGNGVDEISGLGARPLQIAIPSSNIFISGKTTSYTYSNINCDLPTNNGFPHCALGNSYDQPWGNGVNDAFGAGFDFSSNLIWSSYIGGYLEDAKGTKIVVNDDDIKFLITSSNSGTGGTNSIPVLSNSSFYEQNLHGDWAGAAPRWDGTIYGFGPSNEPIFCSYYGGQFDDFGSAITTFQDRLYIGGSTSAGTGFPLHDPSPGQTTSYQTGSGSLDAFFAQIQTSPFVNNEFDLSLEKESLLAFPNPTNQYVTIRWKDVSPDGTTIEFTDVLGIRKIVEKVLEKDEIVLDVSSFVKGIYFVSAISNGKSSCVKLVIK